VLILGINAYHGDSAACLVRDGEVIAAVEEERFRRIKHWAGFPSQAIAYCLSEARAALSDLEIVAVNSNPGSSVIRKIGYTLRHRPHLPFIIDRLRNQGKRLSIESELASAFRGELFKGKLQRVEHHLAHLASAFLVSPFEEACVASIDGFGDFSSAAWGVGCNATIEIEGRVHFPHSLGVFYQALTQHLGFDHYGDEYKVMGLAPYGNPEFLAEMRRVVKLKDKGAFELDTRYFRHHRDKIDYAWDGGSPHVGTLFSSELEALLGPRRRRDEELKQKHFDLARSVQEMYEEAFFHLINHLHENYKLPSLALAGGCAMNSVANGKVMRQSPFKRLYIQSAAGDAGGAIGAAIYAWHQSGNCPPARRKPNDGNKCVLDGDLLSCRQVMDHAYLGPSAIDEDIRGLLERRAPEIRDCGCEVTRFEEDQQLCQMAAEAIASGRVVGWFQGRMEWGPRALGNRSIICDPRREDMKELLNLKIKRREGFRPFAPSVLKEHVTEWFEEDGDVPFMMQVFPVKSNKRPLIPAVTHIDGSGRLQTVYKETNPRFWLLIDSFRRMTGVPMVLNTSFNENEPIVCRPDEALDCFLRTRMDFLFLGNWVVQRAQFTQPFTDITT
jgi:carbamoyltransferase